MSRPPGRSLAEMEKAGEGEWSVSAMLSWRCPLGSQQTPGAGAESACGRSGGRQGPGGMFSPGEPGHHHTACTCGSWRRERDGATGEGPSGLEDAQRKTRAPQGLPRSYWRTVGSEGPWRGRQGAWAVTLSHARQEGCLPWVCYKPSPFDVTVLRRVPVK